MSSQLFVIHVIIPIFDRVFHYKNRIKKQKLRDENELMNAPPPSIIWCSHGTTMIEKKSKEKAT